MTVYTHKHWFNSHLPRRIWVSQFSLYSLSLSPYILFNTIPPCPSQTGEGRVVKEEEWMESTFYDG